MITKLNFAVILFIVAVSVACGNMKEMEDGNSIANFEINDTFELKLNELMICQSDPNLFVKFDSLASDSRCPKDANCIWEGNGLIALGITYKKELEQIQLNTNAQMEQKKSVFGFTFELVALTPYPGDKSQENNPITATILVTKP